MVLRVELSGGQVTTHTQQFDIENRLVAVTATQASGPGQVTRFTYDGDGARIKELEPGGGAVLYVGELYEVRMSGQQVLTRTSYYYHGGVRVALRVTNATSVLYYLHTDHPSLRSGQASVL